MLERESKDVEIQEEPGDQLEVMSPEGSDEAAGSQEELLSDQVEAEASAKANMDGREHGEIAGGASEGAPADDGDLVAEDEASAKANMDSREHGEIAGGASEGAPADDGDLVAEDEASTKANMDSRQQGEMTGGPNQGGPADDGDLAPEASLSEEELRLEVQEEEDPSSEEDLFIEMDQAKSIVESLLFAADKPVTLGTISQVFKGTNIKTKDLRRILEEYQSELADPSRGVVLEEVIGGYQLRTKVDNAEFLKRLNKARPFRLSGPALEVLSIVAYKQPLIKADIDEVRGVESGHLVRTLMERGLVQFAGKSELPGRPMLYATTRKFLEIFGLRNLQELPTLSEIDELLPEGIGDEDEERAATLSEVADSLADEDKRSSYSEGEEDLLKITEKIQSINTASEFFEEEKARMRAQRDKERARDLMEALEVGEEISDKDERWLRRYQQQLEEEAAASEAQAAQAAQQASTETSVAAPGDENQMASSEAEPGSAGEESQAASGPAESLLEMSAEEFEQEPAPQTEEPDTVVLHGESAEDDELREFLASEPAAEPEPEL